MYILGVWGTRKTLFQRNISFSNTYKCGSNIKICFLINKMLSEGHGVALMMLHHVTGCQCSVHSGGADQRKVRDKTCIGAICQPTHSTSLSKFILNSKFFFFHQGPPLTPQVKLKNTSLNNKNILLSHIYKPKIMHELPVDQRHVLLKFDGSIP